MGKLAIKFLALSLLATTLQSCIMNTVKNGIETAVQDSNAVNIKSQQIHEGYLKLHIHNIAENTLLQIDSMEICNILIKDKTGMEITMGNLALDSGTTKLPAQTFTPWNRITLPHNSTGMYITLHGTMSSYLPNGTLFPLYSRQMYLTFPGTISEGQTTEITIQIYDNCPLYCITNGKLTKVLQSISFEVSIDDWEEG